MTQAQLDEWHRAHAPAVRAWIENHERVLEQFAEPGMAVDLTVNLAQAHDRLAPAIEDAIAHHPEAVMRAQLSGLVVASRNTLDALRRSNWAGAKTEHHAYRRYRETWLDRINRSPTAESRLEDQSAHDAAVRPNRGDR